MEYNTEIINNDVLPIPYAIVGDEGKVQVSQLFKDQSIKCQSDKIEGDGRQMRIMNTGNKSYFLFPPDAQLVILRK